MTNNELREFSFKQRVFLRGHILTSLPDLQVPSPTCRHSLRPWLYSLCSNTLWKWKSIRMIFFLPSLQPLQTHCSLSPDGTSVSFQLADATFQKLQHRYSTKILSPLLRDIVLIIAEQNQPTKNKTKQSVRWQQNAHSKNMLSAAIGPPGPSTALQFHNDNNKLYV